ncbi:SH3-like domain-containing protein [Methylopila henanensis]|uniref:SH3-like domain-containing protein n=1 Tax=Methylopila henanensis TaxID=873516 RepID=A0ABW4K9U2_9HYPH
MTPRFDAGDRVLVLDLGKPGHIRTPFYIRGRTGIVLHRCGAFLNPEDLSIGNVGGPVVPLYRVGFPMVELWPDYRGPAADMLCIEIYDHWLAPAAPSAVAM